MVRKPAQNYNRLLTLQIQSVDVVLVAPRNPLNIGAVARAMANFGFRHLWVVDAYEPSWREARSAVGAPEVLLEAREAATLAAAVADCALVLGTGTLTYRKPEQPVVQLPDLPGHLRSQPQCAGRIALVFGSEKSGLSREDLALCHLLVEIPTDPRQPSMNLGQAVAVCLYELATRQFSPQIPPFDAPGAGQPPRKTQVIPATSGRLDLLAHLIQEVMQAVGYSPPRMQPANRHDLRLLLRRLAIAETDLRRILGLFRRILWRLKKGSA